MTSRSNLVGQIQRPGQKPQNADLVVDTRIEIDAEEVGAGLKNVDPRYAVGDLRRYFATLDGTTDDTGAVTRWLSVGARGIELTHPGGNALCSTWTQVVVSADLKIRGAADAEITGTSSASFLQPAGGSIDIEGITFDTWLHVLENQAADSGTTPYLRFVNNYVKNISGDGIEHRRPYNRVYIAGNRFENLSSSNASCHCIRLGDNTYADQDTWQRVIITENEADTVGVSTGTGNASLCLVYGKHVTITDNQIEDVSAATNDAWGVYIKSRYAVISNNNVHTLTSTSGTAQGITVKGSDRTETATPQGYNVVVSGNTLLGSTEGTGILIDNEEVNVIGNVIEGFIEGVVAGGSDNVSINGNIVRCPNKNNGTYGINIGGPASNIGVINNRVYQGQFGIRMVCSTSAAEFWTCDGNQIYDADDAAIYSVNVTTLSNASFCNNHIDTSAKAFQFANLDGIAVKNNTWDNLTAVNVSIWVHFSGTDVSDIEMSDNGSFVVQTTNATTTSAMLLNIPDNSAVQFDAKAVAMESDGSDRSLYGKGGLFYRDGGGATQQGSTYDQFTDIESDATWGGLTLDTSSNQVRARIQGVASQTINWAVDVSIRSVS